MQKQGGSYHLLGVTVFGGVVTHSTPKDTSCLGTRAWLKRTALSASRAQPADRYMVAYSPCAHNVCEFCSVVRPCAVEDMSRVYTAREILARTVATATNCCHRLPAYPCPKDARQFQPQELSCFIKAGCSRSTVSERGLSNFTSAICECG